MYIIHVPESLNIMQIVIEFVLRTIENLTVTSTPCLILRVAPPGDGNVLPDGLCDPGYYCDGGDSTPTPQDQLCWRGYYCLRGSLLPELCPNGTYQYDNGSDVCDECDVGYYCDPVECKCARSATTATPSSVSAPAVCVCSKFQLIVTLRYT